MKNLSIKLLAFQKEVGAIKKDSVNPFFKSKYADINAYIEVVKPLLSNHGLILLQPLSSLNDKPALCTLIVDSESGEKLDLITPLPENPDPQKMGAIITYFRRYAIQSMLCLEAEDDDAEKVVDRTSKAIQTAKNVGLVANEEIPFEDNDLGNCQKCGAPNKWSQKANKPYCGAKCWDKSPIFIPPLA